MISSQTGSFSLIKALLAAIVAYMYKIIKFKFCMHSLAVGCFEALGNEKAFEGNDMIPKCD